MEKNTRKKIQSYKMSDFKRQKERKQKKTNDEAKEEGESQEK